MKTNKKTKNIALAEPRPERARFGLVGGVRLIHGR